MSELEEQHCQACEGGVPPLTTDEVQKMLQQVEGWEANAEGTEISRTFKFKDFYQTIAFVNVAAWIANREDHHPDLDVHYNRCTVRYSTHAIGGLSRNDFICAAKIDALVRH